MMCAHCYKPIQGEPEPRDDVRPSGPGRTVYVCPGGRCTPKSPAQRGGSARKHVRSIDKE